MSGLETLWPFCTLGTLMPPAIDKASPEDSLGDEMATNPVPLCDCWAREYIGGWYSGIRGAPNG